MAHPLLRIQTTLDIFSDSRSHGYVGPSRNVRLPRACASGGGAVCNNDEGTRCAVAGKESLRILRVLDPSEPRNPDHKSAVGHGGFRAEASRNFWDASGLKIDSASTDVAWGSGHANNKILTSARNGELIMWDVNKAKYERRVKDHSRSINKLSISRIVQHYCITGSSDGDLRIWDIRDLSRSINRIHYPTTIRSLVFSPITSQPLQIMVGLDNGNIYRWELKMAQRGQLDRVPVAHTAPVTALDWRPLEGPASLGGVDPNAAGLGWIVSGGLDRTVKVWDLSWPSVSSHIQHKPTYTLHPSFPVRQVQWRPGYECELAIVSNSDFATGSNPDMNASVGSIHRSGSLLALAADPVAKGSSQPANVHVMKPHIPSPTSSGDPIEIWDARRGWIAKWSVSGSAVEGGVTGMTFKDSHAIWAQHTSGVFSQIDLRDCVKPLDSITRVSTTWEASGSLAFISDEQSLWQAPYDDIPLDQRDQVPEQHKSLLKALGDQSYAPDSQTIGTFKTSDNADDMTTFATLAKGYVFHGRDRKDICAVNAQLALQAGRQHVSQVWLLIGACLSELNSEDNGPEVAPRPTMSHTTSTQTQMVGTATPSASYTFPPSSSPGNASNKSAERRQGYDRSTSGSRLMTPSSSKHSSPRSVPLALVPGTPVPASVLARRESLENGGSPLRRPSVYSSPADRSSGSLRHIGEGTLDDSDSSGSESAGNADAISSDEEPMLRSLVSPTLSATRPMAAMPSPLSQFVSQRESNEEGENEDEMEDGQEDGSPSPRSTDSESDEDQWSAYQSPSPHLRARSGSTRPSRRGSLHSSRSRAGSGTLNARSVKRKVSHNSVETVTGGDGAPQAGHGLVRDDTIRDLAQSREMAQSRDKSLAVSDLILDDVAVSGDVEKRDITDRRSDIVTEEEKTFRALAWEALRDCLEEFANEGDVQMCAMLSLVVGKELHIQKRQTLAFLDTYIDLLTRLRLHTPSAHIRKHCEEEGIRQTTLLETTIYTACGWCRKALAVPLGASQRNPNGGYWLCQTCKDQPISCSICRMPVRGLLFQCAICSHGGHQYCYHRYYLNRPMAGLPRKFMPASQPDDRGRSVTRGSAANMNDEDSGSIVSDTGFGDSQADAHAAQHPLPTTNVDNLMGHPCAAGCGHYCWAATGNRDD